MGQIKWYKRDPDAALSGMMMLTLEERGAYNTVLDLLYTRAGDLPDDDRFLAGWMRCDLRVWRRIKSRLVAMGKLTVEGGKIANLRASSEIDACLSRVEHAREAGRVSAAKSQAGLSKSKSLGAASAGQTPQPTTTTPTPRRGRADALPYSSEFEEFWRAYPRRDGSKAGAYKSYQSAIRKGVTHDGIVGGARAYASQIARDSVGKRYIAHATTWLNGQRWESDYGDDRPYHDERPASQGGGKPTWAAEGERLAAKYLSQGAQPGGESAPGGGAIPGLCAPEAVREDPGRAGDASGGVLLGAE